LKEKAADKAVEAILVAVVLVVVSFWRSQWLDPFLIVAAICLSIVGLLIHRENQKPWLRIISPLPGQAMGFENDVHVLVNPPGLRVIVFVGSGPEKSFRWYRQPAPSSIGNREVTVKCQFGNSATVGYGNEHRIKAVCAPEVRLTQVMEKLPEGVPSSEEIAVTRK